MSKNSALKQRLAAEAENDSRWEQSLKKGPTKAPVESPSATMIAHELITRYGKPLREMNTFARAFKTSDKGKITLAVASHLYGKYKVPSFLQDAWQIDSYTPSNRQAGWRVQGINGAGAQAVSEEEIKLRRRWYICAASGGSLYKEHTKSIGEDNFLTKKETHTFLTCPLKVNFREALMYAIASSYSNDLGVKTRIMKSKLTTTLTLSPVTRINNTSYANPVWREVIHFFCANALSIKEINDFVDFFVAQIGREPNYTLKGRNLHSITRARQNWHWELARVKKMGNAQWEGLPIPDESFHLKDDESTEWFFTQIKTSKALAAEGTAMHHCVYSYQPKCIAKSCSIWSVQRAVSKKGWTADKTRCLTIETDAFGTLVQIRGNVNRLPTNEEMRAVNFWASKNGLRVNRYR